MCIFIPNRSLMNPQLIGKRDTRSAQRCTNPGEFHRKRIKYEARDLHSVPAGLFVPVPGTESIIEMDSRGPWRRRRFFSYSQIDSSFGMSVTHPYCEGAKTKKP
ncbi:hypothetical protein NPIL_465871 [Nephila pilipes]|uniref:Uncharacterized protein n=1 Tax=Nephila pilipes TaxID=299642 RepID=A0A8X6PKQ2_NEPPI|nr:hypothetical protein NPIL_465871 [Nephila pilipes]